MHRLTLTVDGSGSVKSDPAGLDCPQRCAADFTEGTIVRLQPLAAASWRFAGFSGSCTGDACAPALSSDLSVTVRFTPVPPRLLTVALVGAGRGSVTSDPPGIDCPGQCSASFAAGASVRLFAHPDALSTLAGFSGACGGAWCDLVLRSDAFVYPQFDRRRYFVTEVITRGWWSFPTAMSPHNGFLAGAWSGSGTQEFIWDGTFRDLGLPAGDVHGVNDSGDVVGVIASGSIWHPFRWSRGAATMLDSLGGTLSIAQAINGDGVIAGWSSRTGGNEIHAVSWAAGTRPVDLGSLTPSCDYSAAFGINSAGIIVGEACSSDGRIHAARFQKPWIIDELSSPGSSARAWAISDRGLVVGTAIVPASNTLHAFAWDGMKTIDAGSLPGVPHGAFVGVNSDGVAVGNSWDDSGMVRRAIVWAGGALVDLNEVVDPSPYLIESAVAIDERGRIAATGRANNAEHTLLLTPR